PDQFLAFAPRLAVGSGGGAIVEDAAIGGPGPAPAVAVGVFRIAFVGAVLAFLGENAGVNPAAAECGAVVFEIGVAGDEFAIGNGVAVHFFQNLLGDGFGQVAFGLVVPGEGAEAGVA